MDPILSAVNIFQKQVRTFQSDNGKSILCVVSSAQHRGLLAKTLRLEEWHPENRSPVIVSDSPWLKNTQDQADIICRNIRDHYLHIVKGFADDGVTLPEFSVAPAARTAPEDRIIDSLRAFTECTGGHLKPPLFCWLPSQVKNCGEWIDVIVYIVEVLLSSGLRLVALSEKEKDFKPLVKRWEDKLTIVNFSVDGDAARDFFEQLLAPPSAGHVLGAPPGAAAPDVQPPPRKIQPPSDDSIKAAIAALNLPPMLSPLQAEALRNAIFAAAFAVGRQNERRAIEEQLKACSICEEAGVRLEHLLMRMTLANYYLVFEREEEAKHEYDRAEAIAAGIPDYPHLAQIRMAQAFIRMRKKQLLDEAIHYYEQSAAAAVIGEVWLLYLESLRMLGSCHIRLKDSLAAMECWQAAVTRARKMGKSEVQASSFTEIAKELIKVLEKEGLDEQADSVTRLLDEINAPASVNGGEAS